MTVKELLLKIEGIDSMDCPIGEKIELKFKTINQFKSEVCKAQRENCSNVFYQNKQLEHNLRMAVLNAIEPV